MPSRTCFQKSATFQNCVTSKNTAQITPTSLPMLKYCGLIQKLCAYNDPMLPELSSVPTLQPGKGWKIASHASSTASKYTFPVSTFSAHLTSSSPEPLPAL